MLNWDVITQILIACIWIFGGGLVAFVVSLILAGLSIEKSSIMGMLGAQGFMFIIIIVLKVSGVVGFIAGVLKLLNWIGILN